VKLDAGVELEVAYVRQWIVTATGSARRGGAVLEAQGADSARGCTARDVGAAGSIPSREGRTP
jgi:hypothetical protein